MTEQLEKINLTSGFILDNFPHGFKPDRALILENEFDIPAGFKILGKLSYDKLPDVYDNGLKGKGRILFCRAGKRDIVVYHGRMHYFEGISMREIGHMIYVLRYLGVKKILSVDEVGHLNPRYNCGEIALIYDHINLTGDNPLIGQNENALGLRFPDMSNAYDKDMFNLFYSVMQKKMLKINESVYVGITGPQTETEAEARFYREIGADVLGYSIVSENIASIHAGMDFAAIGLITRELVADKMAEDYRTEIQKRRHQQNSLKEAIAKFHLIIKEAAETF